MTLSHRDVSEIVAGMILTKRKSPNEVRPEIFFGVYSDLIKLYKGGVTQTEDLVTKVGLDTIQTALHAVESVNGLGDSDWVKILEKTASNNLASIRLEKMGRKGQAGDEIDWAEIRKIMREAQANVGASYVPLLDVEPGEVPFIQSGWNPIDYHLGGIPEVGVIVVGGHPGVGKTSFMGRMAGQFARQYPDKVVAIHSIEMILRELAMRFQEIDVLPDKVKARILLDETPIQPEELITRAATIENLGIVFVDFLDLMVVENSESAYAHVYKTLMFGAKQLHCPIVALAQLSGNYQGGIPRPQYLRYTRLAEALSWMIIMLYNPSEDYFADDNHKDNEILPITDKKGYAVCWKVRGGFRKHKDESPGAIMIPFKGSKGWHPDERGKWFSLRKGT